VAAEITYRQHRSGADSDAFDPIVASGDRGSLPHGRASNRTLRPGDLVTLDFGCTVKGYHSDLTRTVALGRVTRRGRECTDLYEAQQAAIAQQEAECAPVAGCRCASGDHRRRYGLHSHSLGHGLGLHIQSAAYILAEHGHAHSRQRHHVEPASHPGGVARIEDDLLLTPTGNTVLTTAPKHLWFSDMTLHPTRRRVLVVAYYFPPMGLSGCNHA
jgi:Xaa-Pro aminopeptidase